MDRYKYRTTQFISIGLFFAQESKSWHTYPVGFVITRVLWWKSKKTYDMLCVTAKRLKYWQVLFLKELADLALDERLVKIKLAIADFLASRGQQKIRHEHSIDIWSHLKLIWTCLFTHSDYRATLAFVATRWMYVQYSALYLVSTNSCLSVFSS